MHVSWDFGALFRRVNERLNKCAKVLHYNVHFADNSYAQCTRFRSRPPLLLSTPHAKSGRQGGWKVVMGRIWLLRIRGFGFQNLRIQI